MRKSLSTPAVLVVLILVTLAASAVLSALLNQELQAKTGAQANTPTIWPEAFYNGTLCIRNIGSAQAKIDALYYMDDYTRQPLLVKRVEPPVKLDPGEVECINVDSLPPGLKPRGNLRLVLAGEAGPLASYDVPLRNLFEVYTPPPPGGGGLPSSSQLARIFLLVNTSNLQLSGGSLASMGVEWPVAGDGHGTAQVFFYYSSVGGLGGSGALQYYFITFNTSTPSLTAINITHDLGNIDTVVTIGDYAETCPSAGGSLALWAQRYSGDATSPYALSWLVTQLQVPGGSLPTSGGRLSATEHVFKENVKNANRFLYLVSYGGCAYDASTGSHMVYGNLVDYDIDNSILLFKGDYYLNLPTGGGGSPSIYTIKYQAGTQSYHFTNTKKPVHIANLTDTLVFSGDFVEQVVGTTPTYLTGLMLTWPKTSPFPSLGGGTKLVQVQPSGSLPPLVYSRGASLLLASSDGAGSGFYLATLDETALQNLAGSISVNALNVTSPSCSGSCEVIDLSPLGGGNVLLLLSAGSQMLEAFHDTPSSTRLLLALVNLTDNSLVSLVEVGLTVNGTGMWLSDVRLRGVESGLVWIAGYYGEAPFELRGMFTLGLNLTVVEGSAVASDVALGLGDTTVVIRLSNPAASVGSLTLTLTDRSDVLNNVQFSGNYLWLSQASDPTYTPMPPSLLAQLYSG